MWSFRQWRQQQIVERFSVDPQLWKQAFQRLPLLEGLTPEEHERLCCRSLVFLHDKHLTCVQGLPNPELADRLHLALQAQLPLLNLPDLDWYQNIHELVLYPGAFHSPQKHRDASGIIREWDGHHSGETWRQGPVVLAWPEVLEGGGWTGRNLVIHELAHKLDMLNGPADGFPPLHGDMVIEDWANALQEAFDQLNQHLKRHPHAHPPIDPYAAENPAEFFAVTTEYFFTAPQCLHQHFPLVYQQLSGFYRQQPLERWRQHTATTK